jgi:hypothetical protein
MTSRGPLDDEEDASFAQSYISSRNSTTECWYVGIRVVACMLRVKQEEEFTGAPKSKHVLESYTHLQRLSRQMIRIVLQGFGIARSWLIDTRTRSW